MISLGGMVVSIVGTIVNWHINKFQGIAPLPWYMTYLS
jgi:hypothetical protein